ncbi:Nucleolar pre-ribosomal-associated protein 1 [Macleaya cordata]|uniref:Nucleolar pre-ribosomal-associated protein 1 n=1 Tax=Macleaya cordata TaxID=56857 RepID=A0A200Q807_MACCD|nr:Nucleolar pre-ribosomal-associated protein 1 [Macleaya cordata]
MVCTDPCNGLMPDIKVQSNPLKGNRKRLLDLMKKLKATDIGYHRDLLLAIVNGRPSFGSAYMDEFPYNLEPRSSPTWFAAVSLVADLVSSASTSYNFGSLPSQKHDPPTLDSFEVQCMLKCIIPRAFSRGVINRGLQHDVLLVRHGCVRFLLEALKLLDNLISAIDCISHSNNSVVNNWLSLKQDIQDEARALLPDPQVLFL